MQDCGYQFVAAFALTEDCWTKNYFEPREQAINKLIEKHNNCNTVMEYAELNRREAELYRKYKQHYGYVFYIGRNTDNSNLRGGLYIEPVCTVPDYRGKGMAKAVIYEALNRAKSFGAKNAYVISDTSFYERLGFRKDRHFTFYWKG